MNQNSCRSDLLAIDLTAGHMFDGVFRAVRIHKVNITEAATKRLEAVHGKIYLANLSVRAEDFNNVILDNVPCQTSDVNSRRPRGNRPFLPPPFGRSGAGSAAASVFVSPIRRCCLRLLVFLIIVTFGTTTFCAFLGFRTDCLQVLRRFLDGRASTARFCGGLAFRTRSLRPTTR